MNTVRIFSLLFAFAFPPFAHAAPSAAGTAPTVAVDPWDAIKDNTYQKRADLIAGTTKMSEKIDAEIAALNAKRANLPETSVKDWDVAMKELKEARAYLKFTIDSLSEASSETWAEAKDKVAQAWKRTKDACDKVRASTTT